MKKRLLLTIVMATVAISVCKQGYSQESNSTKLDGATNSSEIARVNADELFIPGSRLLTVGKTPVDIGNETLNPGDKLDATVKLNGKQLIFPSALKYPSAFDVQYLPTGHIKVLKAYY
jgi:hypothetical protein